MTHFDSGCWRTSRSDTIRPAPFSSLSVLSRRVRQAFPQAARSARAGAHSPVPTIPDQGKTCLSVHLRSIGLRTALFSTLTRFTAKWRSSVSRSHGVSEHCRMILSREEVKALLEAPRKLRDRAVLAVLYGSGLRVSEATQLRPGDIDAVGTCSGCVKAKAARTGRLCCRPATGTPPRLLAHRAVRVNGSFLHAASGLDRSHPK